MTPLSKSWTAPETISAAEAVLLLTRMAKGTLEGSRMGARGRREGGREGGRKGEGGKRYIRGLAEKTKRKTFSLPSLPPSLPPSLLT
jgi:hypothetical protein